MAARSNNNTERSSIEHSIERRGPGLKALVCFVRILIAVGILILLLILSETGGVLNRFRGGFIDLSSVGSYWLEGDLHRELFSILTGILVFFLCGFHVRAGITVWLLTQASLYIGWGSYVNIGRMTKDHNDDSCSDTFDWVLGRQENLTQKFLRDYSGLSLRGLIWTLPQGYALQQLGFGWQYSLSGSLMGVVYFAGSNMGGYHDNFMDTTTGFSEYMWGTFLWFIILVCCITQGIHRIRCWVYSKSTSSITSPYTRIDQLLYLSLNNSITEILYNLIIVLFWGLFAVTVVYYALTIQVNISQKGQNIFGLFSSVICLTFFISWKWSSAYHEWIAQRAKVRQVTMVTTHSSSRVNDIDRLERGGGGNNRETDPLLPWPYSHPDKGDRRISPVANYDSSSRSNTPIAYSPIPFPLRGSSVSGGILRNSARGRTFAPRRPMSRVSLAFVLIWPLVEKWIWLDLFAIFRHLIGFLSLMATLVVLTTTSLGFALNLDAARFGNTTCT